MDLPYITPEQPDASPTLISLPVIINRSFSRMVVRIAMTLRVIPRSNSMYAYLSSWICSAPYMVV